MRKLDVLCPAFIKEFICKIEEKNKKKLKKLNVVGVHIARWDQIKKDQDNYKE